MPELTEIQNKIDALNERAAAQLAEVEAEPSKAAEVKAVVDEEIRPQLATLTKERDEKIKEEEQKALKGELTTLKDAIDQLRKPAGDFRVGAEGEAEGKGVENDPYADGAHSYFADVKAANKGAPGAAERLKTFATISDSDVRITEEGKAMSEGVAAQGGYLVRPQVERVITNAVESDNVLRGLCSKINITTNSIQLDQISLTTTAGWVAELAVKPETTSMALASITANVFTVAGLATISNQLLADSNPSVDGLVTADLAKRIVAVEETGFLTGSGTNQPLGLLNTPGLGTQTVTSTDVSADGGLLDKILDAIGQVQADHGNPTAIVMHPRTWTRIIKDKDAEGSYVISPDLGVQGDRLGVSQTLWGTRVVLSNRIPTNLGAGTNESRVVVGDFSEALILDRQGITVDESPHVYFTSNQTVFRAEKRVGFTAARTPLAFQVIGGVGLASG